MKGKNGVTHRNPGDYFSTPKNIKKLRKKVIHSLCQKNYEQYDLVNQIPHDAVHGAVGGVGKKNPGQMA